MRFVFSFFVFPVVYFFSLFNKDILFDLTKDDFSKKFSYDYKVKFTELQAAIGYKMLDVLDSINKKRKHNYETLINNVKGRGFRVIKVRDAQPIFFPIIVKEKGVVYNHLLKMGIDTISRYYGYSLDNGNVEKGLLLLPLHINVNGKDIHYLSKCLNSII